jgi:hypothetical protein
VDADLFEIALELVADGLQLALAGAGTENEVVGDLRELAKVEDDDVLAFQLVADPGTRDGELFGAQERPS